MEDEWPVQGRFSGTMILCASWRVQSPVRIEGETKEMLAVIVMGAVVIAFLVEAMVVAFDPDQA